MRKRIVVGGLVAAMATLALVGSQLADLQPSEIAEVVRPEDAERGRALLEALADAHGRRAWLEHEVLRFEMTDEWGGVMGKMSNPFEVERQTLDAAIATREWTARFELTNGPARGTRWGIAKNDVYVQRPSGEVEMPPKQDLSSRIPASFLVPTLRYFTILPVEIANAEIVAALPAVEEDGRTFDRVYATWGSVEANAKYDQYVLWIDRASGRLDRVAYTVREMMRGAVGIARYERYTEVDGAVVPAAIRIHAVLPGGIETPLHTMTFEGATFEDGAVAALQNP